MGEIGRLYTSAQWKAKPGKEKEFIQAWQRFASWTAQNFKASGARLIQDMEDPTRFVSFGRWDSQASIDDWRKRSEFEGFIKQARELCEVAEPHTFKVSAEAG